MAKKKATKKKSVKKKSGAKKKSVKKKTSGSKKASKKTVSNSSVKKTASKPKEYSIANKKVRATKRKFSIVFSNLIFFLALSVVSFLAAAFSQTESLSQVFTLFFIVTGVIFIAFFMALIVLFFIRLMEKR